MARWPNLYPWDAIGKTPFLWIVPENEELGQRSFKAEASVRGATREKRATVNLSSIHPGETNIVFFDLTAW